MEIRKSIIFNKISSAEGKIEILQFEELRKHAYTMSEEHIWICEATPKYKGKFADKVLIKVGDEAIPYESLLPADRNSYSQDVQPFFYIYVDGNKINRRGEMMRVLNEEIKKYVFNSKTKVEHQ